MSEYQATAVLLQHIVFLRTVVRMGVLLHRRFKVKSLLHLPRAYRALPREMTEGVDQRLVLLLAIPVVFLEAAVRHMGMLLLHPFQPTSMRCMTMTDRQYTVTVARLMIIVRCRMAVRAVAREVRSRRVQQIPPQGILPQRHRLKSQSSVHQRRLLLMHPLVPLLRMAHVVQPTGTPSVVIGRKVAVAPCMG